jgi:SAM-dependent methyltransferase
MSFLGRLHTNYVHSRRVTVLRDSLSDLIPPNSTVLDVGCGDGLISRLIMDRRPDVQLSGIDVMVRSETRISVSEFNGIEIPFPDKSFDAVMFVDVLHHTDDPLVLLREAKRVARKFILIKDHRRNGLLAGSTLRFMDWIGNAHHGVALPYNYWPHDRWGQGFSELGLKVSDWNQNFRLYPVLANLAFGRSLHFIARLDL